MDDPQDIICVDSVDTLEKLSGVKVTDLHKHFIDKIEILKDGKKYRRTPEVLDCWFESGSMPYAQSHYPFENKEFVEKNLPADFIAEGLDQTRGWFYALMVLSTALFDKPPFQHVVVNGLILAEDGHKMSKHLKNYPDPMNVIEKYGADALRLCLLASPVVRAEDLRFSETAVREIMRTVLLPLWNSYSFLATYARIDKWRPEGDKAAPPAENPENVLDRWILSKLAATLTDVRDAMDAYDLQGRHQVHRLPRRAHELVYQAKPPSFLEKHKRLRQAGGIPDAPLCPPHILQDGRTVHPLHHGEHLQRTSGQRRDPHDGPPGRRHGRHVRGAGSEVSARHCDLKVVGVSVITNLAEGMSPFALSHVASYEPSFYEFKTERIRKRKS